MFAVEVLLKGREPSKIGVRMREDVHSLLILILHGLSDVLGCWLLVDVCEKSLIMGSSWIIALICVVLGNFCL